jgi:hypothetical protein
MSNTVVTLSGDDANLYKAYQRIIAQQAKIDAGLKGVGDQAKKAKTGLDSIANVDLKSPVGSMGDLSKYVSLTSLHVTSLIGNLGGIQTAIELATSSWELYRQAQQAALKSQEGLGDENRRLIQVAKDPTDLANMQKRSDLASMRYGVARDVSRDVLFSARSEGFESDFEKVIEAAPVVDPRAAATVAGKVPTLFQGRIKPIEAVNLGLRAAQESNLNFEQLATSLPTAAEGGALVGASPQELFAVQAVLASRFKSADTSADRIKTFASTAGIDPRLAGKGIIGSYEAIKAMPQEERDEYLGKNMELNAVYKILGEEMVKIKDQRSKLEKELADFASGAGMLRSQLNLARGDQQSQNVIAVQRARIKEEIAKENNLAKSAGSDERARLTASMLVERKNAGLADRLATWTAEKAIGVVGSGTSPEARAVMASSIGDAVTGRTGATARVMTEQMAEYYAPPPGSETPQQIQTPTTPKQKIPNEIVQLLPGISFVGSSTIQTATSVPIARDDVSRVQTATSIPVARDDVSRVQTAMNTTVGKPATTVEVKPMPIPTDTKPLNVQPAASTESVATTQVKTASTPQAAEVALAPVVDVNPIVESARIETRLPTAANEIPVVPPPTAAPAVSQPAPVQPSRDSAESLAELRKQSELMAEQNALLRNIGTPAATTNTPPNPALINQQQTLRGQ